MLGLVSPNTSGGLMAGGLNHLPPVMLGKKSNPNESTEMQVEIPENISDNSKQIRSIRLSLQGGPRETLTVRITRLKTFADACACLSQCESVLHNERLSTL